MDVGPSLVADGEATKLGEPRQRSLDDPPATSQPLTGLDPAPGDAGLDAAAGQRLTTAAVVVGLVGVGLRGTLARRSQHERIGGMASTTASSIRLSWTFAPVSFRARGMPFASVTMWRFVPGLPRSVGFGPVAGPPFGCNRGAVEGGSAEVDAILAAEPVEQLILQTVPHSGLLPVPQASPAGPPRAAAHLPGQQLPRRA